MLSKILVNNGDKNTTKNDNQNTSENEIQGNDYQKLIDKFNTFVDPFKTTCLNDYIKSSTLIKNYWSKQIKIYKFIHGKI